VLDVLLVVAAHAALFFVVGFPVALCLRRRSWGWASLIVDALAGGLILVTLAISFYGWFGLPGPIIIAVLWVGSIVFAIVTRAGFPSLWRPVRRDWFLVGAWAVVLIAAIALRLRSVNFLPWVGDMGAYVNWANEFVRTGTLHATWPPLFSSYLAIAGALFGPAYTTAAVPFAGLLLVLIAARVTRALGAGRWATLITAAVVTVSVHAIWYSSFPASESLNAPLFLAWVGCLLGVLRSSGRQRIVWAVASAVSMTALGLARGDGPVLLAPLLVFAVLVLVVPDWRRFATRVWLAFAGSLLGGLLAFWYGIERIPTYFVVTQIQDLMPGSLFHALSRLGLFSPTVSTAVALLAIGAVVCAAGLILARRLGGRDRTTRVPRLLGRILGIALFVGIAADAAVNGEVWHILLREGLWLAVAFVLFVFFLWRSKLPQPTVAFVLFLGFIGAIFLAIQSYRLQLERTHSFYLYWDRYLVSEVIPILFVLFGLAASAVWTQWVSGWVARRLASSSAGVRALPAILATVLALAAVVPALPQIVLIEKDTYMQGAYPFEKALIGLIPSKTTPILWSASEPVPAPGFFFPNTWMAFAKPMARSFGYTVISDRGSDFAPDTVLSASALEQKAVCHDSNDFTVFEAEVGGPTLSQRVTTDGITLTPLGVRHSDISLLSQPPKNGDWTHFRLTVRAWTVHVDPSLTAGQTCQKT
jgi:hypothetical protein